MIECVEVALLRLLRVGKLPVLEMGETEFARLGEYSFTMPTGVAKGKRWRRNLHWCGGPGGALWVVGEYGDPSEDGKKIGVKWYRPELRAQRVIYAGGKCRGSGCHGEGWNPRCPACKGTGKLAPTEGR